MAIKLNLLDRDYATVRVRAKQHFIEKAIENGLPIGDVNFDGSNFNTIIDILTYYYVLMSTQLDININEIYNPSTEPTVMSIIKKYGYIPQTKTPSFITLQLNSPNVITNINSGDIIECIASYNNETINYKHIATDSFSVDETPMYFVFHESNSVAEQTYYIDNTLSSQTSFIKLLHKWEINLDSLSISTSNGIPFTRIDQLFTDNSDIDLSNVYLYELDFTDDKLIVRFGNGRVGIKYKGNIVVNYDINNGSTYNGISEEQFEISHDTLQLVIDTNNLKFTSSGKSEESISQAYNNAIYSLKSNERLVTYDDYLNYISSQYPSYNIKLKGGDELSPPLLGKILLSMYKINNEVGVNLDMLTSDGKFIPNLEKLNTHIPMGIKIIPIEQRFVNLFLKLNMQYDSKLNKNILINMIKKQLVNYINNFPENKYVLSKYEIIKNVLDSSITGILDFNVQDIMLKTPLNISNQLSANNYTYYNQILPITTDNIDNIPNNISVYIKYQLVSESLNQETLEYEEISESTQYRELICDKSNKITPSVITDTMRLDNEYVFDTYYNSITYLQLLLAEGNVLDNPQDTNDIIELIQLEYDNNGSSITTNINFSYIYTLPENTIVDESTKKYKMGLFSIASSIFSNIALNYGLTESMYFYSAEYGTFDVQEGNVVIPKDIPYTRIKRTPIEINIYQYDNTNNFKWSNDLTPLVKQSNITINATPIVL